MKLMQVIRSADRKINLLALVSIVCIFLHDIYWTSLPELFQGGDELMNSMYNALMGYVVSYVFFILVVQYKEYKDSQYVNAIVRPVLESMVANHMEINKTISVGLNSQGFNGLSPKTTESLFNKLAFNDTIPDTAENYIFGGCTWIQYFDYQRKYILRELDTLKPYISHIEPELAELLHRYNNCAFYIMLSLHLDNDRKKENLSFIGRYYSEYSLLGKKLFEYVKKLP